MSRRNAHAVAASRRKAGPMTNRGPESCAECGKKMGYGAPDVVCGECAFWNDEAVYVGDDNEEK